MEILENISPFVEPTPPKTSIVKVAVSDFDTLNYYQGKYTGYGRKRSKHSDLWDCEHEGTGLDLVKGRINEADIRGKRNIFGMRVSFRWKPSPTDLDLFIEAATGHRPIFSE
jgi:hypothetical protein